MIFIKNRSEVVNLLENDTLDISDKELGLQGSDKIDCQIIPLGCDVFVTIGGESIACIEGMESNVFIPKDQAELVFTPTEDDDIGVIIVNFGQFRS